MLRTKKNYYKRFCLLLLVLFSFGNNIFGQVTLGVSPYTENFNGIGAGLPTGWSVRYGCASTGPGCLGTSQAFVNAATAWNVTTGNYRNCASANVGAGTDNAATQAGRADRAPAVKNNSSTFVDGQGAFVLQIANTTGKYGFQISFKAQLLDVQGRTNTFLVDYAFGAAPTSFTQAAIPFTFTDLGINSGSWGQTTINVNFGNALDNNASTLWVRIANLTVSTGSGSRCTFGIDDVNLTWSTVPATVALSSPNPSVAAGSIVAGSTNNVLYRADVTVANCASSLTALNLTTAGTYAATDLVNLKLWYQATTPFNSASATLITTKTTGLGAGVQSFTGMNQAYPVGTRYLFVTADLACNANTSNTINVNTPVATDFSFGATVPTGTLFAGGVQTFTGITPSNVTGVTCTPGNGELDIAWTNPSCYDEIMIVATDNAGGVSSVPTGNGSLYTANADYNDGTNFANLSANEFCIYKGTASPVTMTNLINGVTYYTKVFTRIGTSWSSGATCSTTPVPATTGDFRSITNGNWTNYLTWERFNGTSWVATTLPTEYPNSQTSNVTIQGTTTVTLDDDGISVRSLTVNAGGKVYCAAYTTNRYLSIFGSIVCNGTIGNAPTQDYICFNIESATCNVTGSGSFNCNRIRKNAGVNLTTNLNINANITLWWTGTAIYNAYNGAANYFNVTIAAGRTVNCSNGGSYAIDGQTGSTPGTSAGTTTVNGTLTVASTLYLTCFNPAPYSCNVTIGPAGTINAATVSMAATAGGASHVLAISSGGKLNITGTTGISPFSTSNNIYVLSAGSTVEYSAVGNEPVESGLSYSNLIISGSGTKTSNGNVSVGSTFTLAAGSFSQNVGANYYTTTIAASGILTGNGGTFAAGDAGGVLSFAGAGTINGTTAIGFDILKINTGTVTNSLNGSTCDTLNLTGGIFSIGSANTFNMLANGVVTATAGDFITGANGGIVNFQGAGKFIGNSNPYNVYTSGGVDFGTGTVTIQGGGSFRINNGGYAINNGCFYATNSTLVYNTGNTFGAGTEWYALFASGRGVPYNVQIGTAAVSNSKVDFLNSSAWRQMNGSLFIGPSAGGANYGLILSSVFGGDIIVGGDWTRYNTGTFTHNTRSVTFNGASTSTITVGGAGTETFAYLIINKSSGVSVVQAGSPNATTIQLNGSGGGNTLQMISGNLDLNQQTFNFASYFNSNQNNLGIDGTAGNLTRNVTSTGGQGIFAIYNSDAANHYVTISRMSGNASLLVFGTTVMVTTGAATTTGGGVNFGNTLTTINGILQINTYGYVTLNPPSYGTGSFLKYNSSGAFDRNVEWGSLSGPGYPYHVTVQNNTNLVLNTAINGNADRAMAGNLLISSGSSLTLGATYANKLTVAGNVQIDGTLTLPTVVGGDIYIAGDWNRSATGVFTPNNRAVFFNGSGNSTITANGGQLFPYLYLVKAAVGNTLSLVDDISISQEFGVTSGTFDPAAKDATLKSNASGTASFGQVGASGDVAYSGAGRFIVERYIPTGAGHAKSWQLLAVPDNGGQTINAAWQEGNVLPTTGAVNLGTTITGPTAAAGFDIITSNPSMKTFVPATATYIGVPNTLSTAIFNKQGYFVLIRGDRTVTTYTAPATVTTLRTRGKLFVPVSNPPLTTTVLAGKFESIGNPYASAIDFKLLSRPAAPAIDSTFYVWDPLLTGSNPLGGYQTISSSNGWKPSPGSVNYPAATVYTKIQSGQAFFVHATGAGGVISFTESAKLSGSSPVFKSANGFPGNSISERRYFRAQLYTSDGILADGNVVAFDENFSNDYESNDALKLPNSAENFGIISNAQLLAIEARKIVTRSDTIQYSINSLQPQAYQFRFGPENMQGLGISVWLKDRWLGTTTRLDINDSSFINFNITSDPASAAANRFYLIFRRWPTPATTANPVSGKNNSQNTARNSQSTTAEMKPEISIYPNPVVNKEFQVIFKNNPAGNYQLQLVNSTGQVVYDQRTTVKGNYFTRSFHIASTPAGYYRLTIIAEDGSKTIQSVIVE
ncbi:MAG: T9SS type A sorting domain-containing protein [Ferruginibacter sp.]